MAPRGAEYCTGTLVTVAACGDAAAARCGRGARACRDSTTAEHDGDQNAAETAPRATAKSDSGCAGRSRSSPRLRNGQSRLHRLRQKPWTLNRVNPLVNLIIALP